MICLSPLLVVYINSAYPNTATLMNCVPVECPPLTYDLYDFKSRVDKHLSSMVFFKPVFMGFFKPTFRCFLVALCHLIVRKPNLEVAPRGFSISRQKYRDSFSAMFVHGRVSLELFPVVWIFLRSVGVICYER